MNRSIGACLGLKKRRWERRWGYKRGRSSLLGPMGTFTVLVCERVSEMWNESESVSLTQPCLTLCNPSDSSPAGFSVHGILQARILEWVAIPFSRGSSHPRDQTQVSCIVSRFFTSWAIREALWDVGLCQNLSFFKLKKQVLFITCQSSFIKTVKFLRNK